MKRRRQEKEVKKKRKREGRREGRQGRGELGCEEEKERLKEKMK